MSLPGAAVGLFIVGEVLGRIEGFIKNPSAEEQRLTFDHKVGLFSQFFIYSGENLGAGHDLLVKLSLLADVVKHVVRAVLPFLGRKGQVDFIKAEDDAVIAVVVVYEILPAGNFAVSVFVVEIRIDFKLGVFFVHAV